MPIKNTGAFPKLTDKLYRKRLYGVHIVRTSVDNLTHKP